MMMLLLLIFVPTIAAGGEVGGDGRGWRSQLEGVSRTTRRHHVSVDDRCLHKCMGFWWNHDLYLSTSLCECV